MLLWVTLLHITYYFICVNYYIRKNLNWSCHIFGLNAYLLLPGVWASPIQGLPSCHRHTWLFGLRILEMDFIVWVPSPKLPMAPCCFLDQVKSVSPAIQNPTSSISWVSLYSLLKSNPHGKLDGLEFSRLAQTFPLWFCFCDSLCCQCCSLCG